MGAEQLRGFIQEHPSVIGWAAVGALVASWDLFAPETLSHGVDTALENHRALTTFAVGYVACHLLNILPEQVDAIHGIGQIARRVK